MPHQHNIWYHLLHLDLLTVINLTDLTYESYGSVFVLSMSTLCLIHVYGNVQAALCAQTPAPKLDPLLLSLTQRHHYSPCPIALTTYCTSELLRRPLHFTIWSHSTLCTVLSPVFSPLSFSCPKDIWPLRQCLVHPASHCQHLFSLITPLILIRIIGHTSVGWF